MEKLSVPPPEDVRESGVHGERERATRGELLVEVAEEFCAVVEADARPKIAAHSAGEERGARSSGTTASERKPAEHDRVPVAADQFKVECEGPGVIRGQIRGIETHVPDLVGASGRFSQYEDVSQQQRHKASNATIA